MDFRHLIVTCLFSMLRLSFETQKIKKNYAILYKKVRPFTHDIRQKPAHIVALGNAYTAVGHYKQSRIGLAVVVNGYCNPVRTQS